MDPDFLGTFTLASPRAKAPLCSNAVVYSLSQSGEDHWGVSEGVFVTHYPVLRTSLLLLIGTGGRR